MSFDHLFVGFLIVFFFNDAATTEIYTLSLHDALPISGSAPVARPRSGRTKPPRKTAVPRPSCYSFPWRDLRRRANAGCESLTYSEITPPFFHHFRYGTSSKLTNYTGTVAYMTRTGAPMPAIAALLAIA